MHKKAVNVCKRLYSHTGAVKMMPTEYLTVIPENIPAELKELKQWVVWRPEKDPARTKPKKVPYSLQKDPLTGVVAEKLAAVNNPETWMSFEEALALLKKRKYKGLNFVFPSITVPGSFKKIVGVDLDHIRLSNGDLNPSKIDEVKALNTYAELSPSGEGLRAICFAEFPTNEEVHKGDIEVYQAGKFLSITGHKLTDVPGTVNPAQDAITTFRAKYFKIAEELEEAALPITTTKFADDKIIEMLTNSRTPEIAESFRKMFFDGDIKTASGAEDHSAADFNLCKLIIFWTQDPEQIDRIFRQSKLIRSKWDENHGYANGQSVTYGQKTITSALRARKSVYKGSAERKLVPLNTSSGTKQTQSVIGSADIEIYPYTIRNDGIYKTELSKDVPKTFHEIQISPTPCQIIAIGDNIDTGEILYKLCIIDAKGREKVFWKSGKDLLTRAGALSLIDNGMIFTEPNVNNIESLFDVYINEILGTTGLPEEITASKSGWKRGFSSFVVGNHEYTTDEIKPILQLENDTACLYEKAGNLDEWITAAKTLLEYPAVRFKFYASCTPILLGPLKVSSFLQEQYGPSGLLKTLTGWFCASVWGDPVPLQINAESTPKGIEAFVGFNTDLPTFIDELSTNEKGIQGLIYMIANGVGRSTSNKSHGVVMPKTWSTTLLTTGENPILPSNAKMGQLVRDVPLKGGVDTKLDQNIVSTVETAITENYGHFREPYIQEVFKYKKHLRKIYNEYRTQFPETKDITSERAKKFYAAITTAGYLVEKVFQQLGIPTKDPYEVVNHYFESNVISSTVFIPDYMRALDAVYSWFEANRIYFEEPKEGEKEINHERYGWIRDHHMCFNPNKLEEFVTKAGYNYLGCLEEWKNRGIIVTKLKKNNTGSHSLLSKVQIRVGEAKNPVQVIKIPMRKVENDEEETLKNKDDHSGNNGDDEMKKKSTRKSKMPASNVVTSLEAFEARVGIIPEKIENSLVVTPDEMADFLLEDSSEDEVY